MKKRMLLLGILVILITTGCSIFGSDNKLEGCEDCVYARYGDKRSIGNDLDEYVKDYKKLNNSVFLGHKLDKNKKIEKLYVCGVAGDKSYCLEGSTDGSTYEANKKILNKIYGKDNCSEDGIGSTESDTTNKNRVYRCSYHKENDDDYKNANNATVRSNGSIYIQESKSNDCSYSQAGMTSCYIPTY